MIWNSGNKHNWLQPAVLLVLVLLLILLDAFIWKSEDPLPVLDSPPAPTAAQWLGVHRDQGEALELTRYELSTEGMRWLYLFPANRGLEPVSVELIVSEAETTSLGSLSAQGRLLLIPESQINQARVRLFYPDEPSETLLTFNLNPLEQPLQ